MYACVGVVFYYGLLQLLTWWICHVAVLFWKIKFPFRARSLDQSNRTKYIHIACILISLFLPLLPILVTIVNNLDEPRLGTVGFTMTRFPPLLCTSIDSNATFYALVLPVIFIMDTGLALLIIMLWVIHKVCNMMCSYIENTHTHTLFLFLTHAINQINDP